MSSTQYTINRTSTSDNAFINFLKNGQKLWELGPTSDNNFHIRTYDTKSGITFMHDTNTIIINRDVTINGTLIVQSGGREFQYQNNGQLIPKSTTYTTRPDIIGNDKNNNQIFFERNGTNLWQLGPNYQCCGADFWLWNPKTSTNVFHSPINQDLINFVGKLQITGKLQVNNNTTFSKNIKPSVHITPPFITNINKKINIIDTMNINVPANQNSQLTFYLSEFKTGNLTTPFPFPRRNVETQTMMWELGPNYSCCGDTFWLWNQYMFNNVLQIPYDPSEPLYINGDVVVNGSVEHVTPVTSNVSDFPNYITTIDQKNWYLKPQTFTCPNNSYITDIKVNWGSFGSGMDSLNIVCSDGSTGNLGRPDISTPHSYSIKNSQGIKNITLYLGPNQVYSFNGLGLGVNGGHEKIFSCPSGEVINSISALNAYKATDHSYHYPYIAGFKFGCIQKPTVTPTVTHSVTPSVTPTVTQTFVDTSVSLVINTPIINILPSGATGSLSYTVTDNGTSYKKYLYYVNGFSYNQQFSKTLPYSFSNISNVTSNSTGMVVTVTLTSITFYPKSGNTYTGVVIIEGY